VKQTLILSEVLKTSFFLLLQIKKASGNQIREIVATGFGRFQMDSAPRRKQYGCT
jgi:hypothetical protein